MNIVIVGCGNVGLEAAKLLVSGHDLLLISRSFSEEIRAFVAEHPKVVFARADATDMADIEQALKSGGDRFRCIDVLISTVGAPGSASAVHDFNGYKKEFDVNVFGNLVPIQAVLKPMIAQRCGKIIVISSTSGVHTYPGWGAYAPSKWALTNLCQTLRGEVAPHGVSVDIVFPRTIRNQRSKTFLNDSGVEPCQVAREIAAVLGASKGTDRFVPRHYELLRPLERLFPQLLDKKAGLNKRRFQPFRSQTLNSVVITGASSHLGCELARRYATVARHLYLVGPDEAALSEVAKKCQHVPTCETESIVLTPDNIETVRQLAQRTGQADLIVNCADGATPGFLAEISTEACAGNLMSSFLAPVQVLTEYLRRGIGPRKIINVLSTSVATGQSGDGCFSAGQAALWAQTRAMRRTIGNEVQVMEALVPPHDRGMDMTRQAADKIHRAERLGREKVVFPFRSRMTMCAGALCPR